MENENKPIFTDGLVIRMPSEKAPDFILLQMAVKSHNFFKWCQEHQDEKGWVNLTVKKSSKGTIYGQLDTWKPTPKNVDDETGEKIPDDIDRNPVNSDGKPLFQQPLTDEAMEELSKQPF